MQKDCRDRSNHSMSYVVVVIIEVDIPWPLFVPSSELFVVRRAFILGIACQHTLYAHADTLDILHRTPPLVTQKIETYDTIRVDVGVYRNWSTWAVLLQECHLWGFCMEVH